MGGRIVREGKGNSVHYKQATIGISMDQSLRDVVVKHSIDSGIPISTICRWAIVDWLNKQGIRHKTKVTA